MLTCLWGLAYGGLSALVEICFHFLKGQQWISSVDAQLLKQAELQRAEPTVGTVRMAGHVQGSGERD